MAKGENIIILRKQKQMSVRELQEAFGFETPQAIYKWQHGTALPTIDNLVILSAVLDVRMDEILVLQERCVA
ncbi:helix-turn-helix domain-containing protein [Dorea formicigenerans]|nr:helix-turn-helix transcriptional regulator [Dorea formicigenerans]